MSASSIIKKIMIDKKVPVRELANKMGINPRILSNKLYRDTFTLNEYVLIANLLECDVKTISKSDNKEYIHEYEPKDNLKEE